MGCSRCYRSIILLLTFFCALLDKYLLTAFHLSREGSTSSIIFQRSFQLVLPTIVKHNPSKNGQQQIIPRNHPTQLQCSLLPFTARQKRRKSLLLAAVRAPAQQHILQSEADASIPNNNAVDEDENIPSDMTSAVQRFFFGKDHGPKIIVLAICSLLQMRLGHTLLFTSLSSLDSLGPLTTVDLLAASLAIVFWWFQEHFMHQNMLHSKFDWIGKSIHELHHNKPYFSISIDPPSLILGWFAVVFLILTALSPTFSFALSAMIGYSIAGLFYEWTHYIVHTRVIPKKSFFRRVRDHHMRHHLLDDHYWYAFTLPQIDSLFGTNPNVKDIAKRKKNGG